MTACLALCATQVMAASSVQATTSGVLDTQSGLVWQEFASLSAGEALGYRLASDVEFQTLLAHAGQTPGNWSETFASTFYSQSPANIYNAPGGNVLLGMSTQLATKAPLMVTPDYVVGSWVKQDIAFVANTRDNLGAYMLAGLSESTGLASNCSVFGNSSTTVLEACKVTYASALLDRPRLIGQVSSSVPTTSSEASTYRDYLTFMGYTPASDLAYANPQTLGYYMVQAVPEPGTWGLMSFGLLGLAAVRRRRPHA